MEGFDNLAQSNLFKGVDQDPKSFLADAEKGKLEDPLEVFKSEYDETTRDQVQYSDDAWESMYKKVHNVAPDIDVTEANIEALLFSPSTSQYEMSKKVMAPGIKDLKTKVAMTPLQLSQEAEEIVRVWAKQTHRSLTNSLLKALTTALVTNQSLEIDHLDYVVLGWDLRGEHNVNEVKNVVDSQQKALNDILTSQREMKESMKNIVKGAEDAYGRLVMLQERSVPVGTKIYLPDQEKVTIPDVGGLKSNIPDVIGKRELFQGESSQAPQRVSIPAPHSSKDVDQFLATIRKTRSEFSRFIPPQMIDGVFKSFMKFMSPEDWIALPNEQARGPLMQRLSKFLVAASAEIKKDKK